MKQWMNSCRLIVALLFCPTLAVADDGLITQSFQTPFDFLELGRVDPSKPDKQVLAADPFAPVPEKRSDPLASPKAISDPAPQWKSAQALLEGIGIKFPTGAFAKWDIHTGVLTVNNNRSNLDTLKLLFDSLAQKRACDLGYTFQVIQLPTLKAQGVISRIAKRQDHRAELQQLLKSSDPTVKAISTTYILGRPGVRCSIESALQHHYVSAFHTISEHSGSLEFDTMPIGMNLQIDPSLYPDGFTSDLTFIHSLSSAFPTSRSHSISLPATGQLVQQSITDIPPRQETQSQLAQIVGTSNLVSVWQPVGSERYEGQTWLTFASVDSQPRLSKPPPFSTGDLAKLTAPNDMTLYESAVPFGEIQNRWSETSPSAQQYLEARGASFPPGSHVKEGPHGQCIIANTQPNLEIISAALSERSKSLAQRIDLTLYSIRASPTIIREAQSMTSKANDHEAALTYLLAKAEAGEATITGTQHLTADSKSKAEKSDPVTPTKVSTTHDRKALSTFSLDPSGRPRLETKTEHLGQTVVCELKFDPDQRIVEVGLSYESSRPDEEGHLEYQRDQARDGKANWNTWLYSPISTKLNSQFRVTPGSTVLASLSPVVDKQSPTEAAPLEATFVHCELAYPPLPLLVIQPEQEDQARLRTHPKEIATRTFDVPSDFQNWLNENTQLPRSPTQLLREQGINVPEQGAVFFIPIANKLTVTASREALDMVETFLCTLDGYRSEKDLTYTTHHIEVSGTLGRRIIAEARGNPDAKPQLQQLLESASDPAKARILDTLHMVSKSGQRSTADNSRIVRQATGFGCDNDKKPHVTTEEAFVGTRLELEGIISPDARYIQCQFALQHHPAPPSEATLSIEHPGLGGIARLDTLDFHVSAVQGSSLLGPDSTTLVGAYRPENATKDVLHLAFITSHIIWVGRE